MWTASFQFGLLVMLYTNIWGALREVRMISLSHTYINLKPTMLCLAKAQACFVEAHMAIGFGSRLCNRKRLG